MTQPAFHQDHPKTGFYATTDGFVNEAGFGFYRRNAQVSFHTSPEVATSWLRENAPPGFRLARTVTTDRSEHPLGWFSIPGEVDPNTVFTHAFSKGYSGYNELHINMPGTHTDHYNTWVSFIDPIYVPDYQPV